MSSKTSIRGSIQRALDAVGHLYDGRVEQALTRLGVAGTAKGLYYRLWRRTHSGTYTKHFRGVEAEFKIDSQRQYWRAKSIKTELMSSLLDEVSPDDVFYDIGANVGSVSCLVGRSLTNGRVVSFEPLPVNAAALRENVELNGVSGRVFQCALSDENGEVEFQVPASDVEAGSSNAIAPERETSGFWDGRQERITVETRRGDDLIDDGNLPVPNVVKIDIEGSELRAIRGLKEVLSHPDCRMVVCEVHAYLLDDFGGSVEELEAELRDAGFALERFDNREYESDNERVHIYRLKATKR